MKRYGLPLLLAIFPLLLTLGCEPEPSPAPPATGTAISTPAKPPAEVPVKAAPAPVNTRLPFTESLPAKAYELPSGALASWREAREHQPALLLYASHPLLEPIPAGARAELQSLLERSSAQEIVSRSRYWGANPALLPPQTVSAAIDAGLIGELILIRPTRAEPKAFPLDVIRHELRQGQFLTENEARALNLVAEGVISGTVRGLPLRIVHPERLPKLTRPALLHIDLGYFRDMYVNEVKTPSYDLIQQLAGQVADAGNPTVAATLSFSNQEAGLSLESRFIMRDLAAILANPKLLKGATPASWALRASALYAGEMFSEGRARELTEQAVAATPDDAAAHYALALNLFEQNRSEEGFAALDRAARLDSGYALEYLYLAERGLELGQFGKSIELMHKLVAALPDVPFLRLQLANYLIQAGRGPEAVPLVAQLRALRWSETVHPGVVSLLEEMSQVATSNPLPRSPDGPGAPSASRSLRMPGFDHSMSGKAGQ